MPSFDAHGPQRFPGGEQEHSERVRVQLGQPVHRRQRGQQFISLIGQRDQILGTVMAFATEVRSNDLCAHHWAVIAPCQ